MWVASRVCFVYHRLSFALLELSGVGLTQNTTLVLCYVHRDDFHVMVDATLISSGEGWLVATSPTTVQTAAYLNKGIYWPKVHPDQMRAAKETYKQSTSTAHRDRVKPLTSWCTKSSLINTVQYTVRLHLGSQQSGLILTQVPQIEQLDCHDRSEVDPEIAETGAVNGVGGAAPWPHACVDTQAASELSQEWRKSQEKNIPEMPRPFYLCHAPRMPCRI